VVEEGFARGESAQDRALQLPDVAEAAGYQRAPRVGHRDDLAGDLATEAVDRQVLDAEVLLRRAVQAGVGHPDVDRQRRRVVPDLGAVVAGRAGAGDRRLRRVEG